MRKEIMTQLVAGELRTRDYDTIRKAIAAGMTWGVFGLDEENAVAFFEWRLLGDSVEIRERGTKKWCFLDKTDMDFVYSRGVFGEKVEHTIGFWCYDVAMATEH